MARGPRVHVAGIPVRIEPTFLLVIVLLGLPQAPLHLLSWVVIATVSVLLHELGHAVAFRAFGIRPSILLHGFGGLTSGSGELTAGQRIVVSLAGPLSAMVLFGVPAVLLWWTGAVPDGDASTILRQVIWINIGWSLVNLLPVLPLDGGQVFLDVCEMVTGGRGRRAAEVVSVVVAGALGLWALVAGFTFGALLAGVLAAVNISQLRRVRQDELSDRLGVAHRALLEHRPQEAAPVVAEVLAARPKGAVLTWAAELAGWTRLMDGDVDGAVAAVRSASGATPSSSFTGAVALASGQRAEGVAVMAWAFANDEVGPPKSLGAVAVGGTGTATDVARELLLLGESGRNGAVVLRDLLAYAGYRDAVAAVDAVLAPLS
ncbi:MAG TPA: site-2 protease family protein [Acidimicrobiales bacterium]